MFGGLSHCILINGNPHGLHISPRVLMHDVVDVRSDLVSKWRLNGSLIWFLIGILINIMNHSWDFMGMSSALGALMI